MRRWTPAARPRLNRRRGALPCPNPRTPLQTSATGAPQQSLWHHAMQRQQQQQREAQARAREEMEASFGGAGPAADDELFGFDGGGLFAEEGASLKVWCAVRLRT